MVRNGNNVSICIWYEKAMVRNGYGTKMIFTMVRNDCNSMIYTPLSVFTSIPSQLKWKHIVTLQKGNNQPINSWSVACLTYEIYVFCGVTSLSWTLDSTNFQVTSYMSKQIYIFFQLTYLSFGSFLPPDGWMWLAEFTESDSIMLYLYL
jgi:hypothetical protein